MNKDPEITKIKEVFKYLEEHKESLSENAGSFVHSLKKYYSRNKKLSERQHKALIEIKDSICVEAGNTMKLSCAI